MKKEHLSWILRLIISALFIVSAVAKLYPSPYFAISTFEVKQLYPLGFSEGFAPYFSRILIGIEFALGIAILLQTDETLEIDDCKELLDIIIKSAKSLNIATEELSKFIHINRVDIDEVQD